MRTKLSGVRAATVTMIAAAVAAGAISGTAPAQAATSSVTISKISTKKAPYRKTVTVKPTVKVSGQAKVLTKTLTVKRGSKTIARNKTTVQLTAGTYKVTQKVTYQTYTLQTKPQTVTKQHVAVPGLGSTQSFVASAVDVTCTASKVEETSHNAYPSVNVEAQCSSPRFDGEHGVIITLANHSGSTWQGYSTINYDQMRVEGSRIEAGVPFPATLWPWDDLLQSYQVVEDVTTKVYSGTKTKTKSQKLVVKKGTKPTRVWVGGDSYKCPKGYPVKGNADSGIYHVPGGRYYSRTKPEECFSSASAARAAGYRASRAG